MSLNTFIGVVREHTGDALLDRVQTEKNRIVQQLDALPFSTGILITGLRQSDGTVTDGIKFTSAQSIDVPHGLGYVPTGYLVLQSRDSFAQLRRNDDSQDKTFRCSFIRLVHGGGSATRATLWVF